GPVDLQQEPPDVTRRGVVHAERLAEANRLRRRLRRRALLHEAVERVPDRPPGALEERAHERPSSPADLGTVVESAERPPVARADDHARTALADPVVQPGERPKRLAARGQPHRGVAGAVDAGWA